MTREDFGHAYEKGYPLTVRFLVSRGARGERAREVAHAAWVRGWERLSQLREEALVLSWVNSIAINAYRSVLRSEPVYVPLREIRTSPRLNFASFDLSRILKICRPSHRHLLEQEVRGVPVREMALERGISETAVRIRLLRARREARIRMEQRAPSHAAKN